MDGLHCADPDRGRGPTLHTFTAEASAALPGPDWLRRRRAAGFEAFASMPLPSESEEVWRYSPIDDLDLDAFTPVPAARCRPPAGRARSLAELAAALGSVAGSVLVHNGRPAASSPCAGAERRRSPSVRPPRCRGSADLLGSVQQGGDALVRLNDAFAPDAVVVDVPAGPGWPGRCSSCTGVTPRASRSSRACACGPARAPRSRWSRCSPGRPVAGRALVVPVTELVAEDGAALGYVSLQTLPDEDWSIARLAGRGAGGTHLRTFTVGLGGAYERVRADVSVDGKDAHSEILSTYLGDGTQVHDIRTLQDHVAPRTTSELLCQGAVAGTSRSVYSGLIRVHRGAVRSDARQTNHNLVLTRGPTPTPCPTSTSSRTTCAARTPRRWVRSTRTSATTSSRAACRPRRPRG